MAPFSSMGITTAVWVLIAAGLGFLVGLVIRWLPRGNEVEHPRRIDNFIDKLRDCSWSDGPSRTQSMDAIFYALIELFSAEVAYYYRSRQTRRRISWLCRWSGFVFGTAGLIMPFVSTAYGKAAQYTYLGYVFLGLAAAAFAANQLFGGTQGHIRYVTTQYKLEQLIATFAIDCSNWRAGLQATEANANDVAAGFILAKAFATNAYDVLGSETSDWAQALLDAEAAYKASITQSSNKTQGIASGKTAGARQTGKTTKTR